MTSRGITFIAAIVLAVTLSGCTDPQSELIGSPSAQYTDPPLPASVGVAPESAVVPQPDCGDPTASLRPLPAAGTPTPTVDAIRARGRLIVGLDTGSNLMSFRDPTSGTLEGFDVDIAHEIARDLFGDPDRLEYRILTSANREQALQDSTVDIVAKTMTITCERREQVAFSTQYLEAHQRVLVVKGSDIRGATDLADKRVCVVRGTTSITRLQEVQPEAVILTVPMWSDCLVVLQQRQVDAVSTDDTILAGLVTQDPYLEIVGDSMGTEPYGIGITKSNDDLVRFVNGTLERIRGDGTWARIYGQWLTMLGPSPGPPPAVYQN